MNERYRAEAAQWFNRLRAADVSSTDRHAHQAWLEADPEHYAAWAEVEGLWQSLDGVELWARRDLAQLNLQQSADNRKRAAMWFRNTAAAAVAAVVLMGILVLPNIATQDVSDSGTQYKTVVAEQHKVALEDGSIIHLNIASTAQVRYSDEIREVVLSEGEALFDVVHDPNRPFVVSARNSKVIVIGTRFAVRLDSEDVRVTVVEGKVAIAPSETLNPRKIGRVARDLRMDLESDRIFVEPGRQAELDVRGRLTTMRNVDASRELSWQEGKLVFDGVPLREVALELSRYGAVEVRVANEVPDHPVTGIIQIRATEKMVDLLSQVVPVTAVRESGEVTVLYNSS